jgi:hypothetical protein
MKYAIVSHFITLHRRPAVWLAWTAAILYCSWPLGYVLNPFVERHDLASQLEALHEPYAWIFILMDVLTGLAVIAAGVRQFKHNKKDTLVLLCVWSYVAFGLLNAIAALAPLNCDPESHDCGPLIHNPLLIIHGAASFLSPAFLGLGMFALAVLLYRRQSSRLILWIIGAILLAWFVSGAGAALDFRRHADSNLLQYYFITVCSFSILLLVALIEHLQFVERSPQEDEPIIKQGQQVY